MGCGVQVLGLRAVRVESSGATFELWVDVQDSAFLYSLAPKILAHATQTCTMCRIPQESGFGGGTLPNV